MEKERLKCSGIWYESPSKHDSNVSGQIVNRVQSVQLLMVHRTKRSYKRIMNTNVLDVIMQTVTWMHTGCTDFVQIFELVPVTQRELNFFGYSAKKN